VSKPGLSTQALTQPAATGRLPPASAAVLPGSGRLPARTGDATRWRRHRLAAGLALALLGGPARAVDGGQPAEAPAPEERTLSAEDQEAVENLELLESLDEVDQLELLLELSRGEG